MMPNGFKAGDRVLYLGRRVELPGGDRLGDGLAGTVVGAGSSGDVHMISVHFDRNRDAVDVDVGNVTRVPPVIAGGLNMKDTVKMKEALVNLAAVDAGSVGTVTGPGKALPGKNDLHLVKVQFDIGEEQICHASWQIPREPNQQPPAQLSLRTSVMRLLARCFLRPQSACLTSVETSEDCAAAPRQRAAHAQCKSHLERPCAGQAQPCLNCQQHDRPSDLPQNALDLLRNHSFQILVAHMPLQISLRKFPAGSWSLRHYAPSLSRAQAWEHV
jgi:hypothetical protein